MRMFRLLVDFVFLKCFLDALVVVESGSCSYLLVASVLVFVTSFPALCWVDSSLSSTENTHATRDTSASVSKVFPAPLSFIFYSVGPTH